MELGPGPLAFWIGSAIFVIAAFVYGRRTSSQSDAKERRNRRLPLIAATRVNASLAAARKSHQRLGSVGLAAASPP